MTEFDKEGRGLAGIINSWPERGLPEKWQEIFNKSKQSFYPLRKFRIAGILTYFVLLCLRLNLKQWTLKICFLRYHSLLKNKKTIPNYLGRHPWKKFTFLKLILFWHFGGTLVKRTKLLSFVQQVHSCCSEDGMNCAFTNGKKPDKDYKNLIWYNVGGGWLNNPPPQDIHVLTPEPVNMLPYMLTETWQMWLS